MALVKLLIYSHYFAPSVGGVETIAGALAHGLAEWRPADGTPQFEITLVTNVPRGDFVDSQLPYRIIRNPGLGALWRIVKGVDVVHVAGAALAPMLIGLLLRRPVVVEHHGFQTICPTGQMVREPEIVPCPGHFMARQYSRCLRCSVEPRRMALVRLWLLTFVRRILCQFLAVNITPTSWLATQLKLPRCQTVPHGSPDVPRLLQSKKENAVPTVVFVGRLVSSKGLRVLLDAIHILKDGDRSCELRIVGDGPERLTLENHAQHKGIAKQVHFLGRLSDSELLHTLSCADVLVAPSLGGEVFGMVLVENMLRGLPIVASDLGAYREVLGDDGITFRTGDASDLAQKLSIVFNEHATGRIAIAARERALRMFTLENMIAGHAVIYRQLLPKNGPR